MNPLLTRQDLQRCAEGWLADPAPRLEARPGHLAFTINQAWYTDEGAGMEGFCRCLWARLALVLGGGPGVRLPAAVREGIIAGTDPASPSFWGEIVDVDQRMVEYAILGLFLALRPEDLWDPLTAAQRGHLARFLGRINTRTVVPNNWLFFRIFANCGLRRVGAAWDAERLHGDLEALDGMARGDGWRSDGIDGACDWYNPMAMQFYALVYGKVAAPEDAPRVARWRAEAVRFAHQFLAWHQPDGALVPYGRSLTYRFAPVGFWAALAWVGADPFPPGVLKGLVLRQLRWWLALPGGERVPVERGFGYPNDVPCEGYNGPGAALWAFKGLWALALPEDHPFWTAPEAPLPAQPPALAQPSPRLLLAQGDGHTYALAAGQPTASWLRHGPDKYARMVYSATFAFSVPTARGGLAHAAPDAQTLVSLDGHHWLGRLAPVEHRVEDDRVVAVWEPTPGVRITTILVPEGAWHRRIHEVVTTVPLHLADGGFAVPLTVRERACQVQDTVAPGARTARLEAAGRWTDTWGGEGWETLRLVALEPGGHLLHPGVKALVLTTRVGPGSWRLESRHGGGSSRR